MTYPRLLQVKSQRFLVQDLDLHSGCQQPNQYSLSLCAGVANPAQLRNNIFQIPLYIELLHPYASKSFGTCSAPALLVSPIDCYGTYPELVQVEVHHQGRQSYTRIKVIISLLLLCKYCTFRNFSSNHIQNTS